MQMKTSEARKRIQDFVMNHKNSSVLFASLDDEGRMDYVMTKTYNYFRGFLKGREALERAIRNAESHKENGFAVFLDRVDEHIIITD